MTVMIVLVDSVGGPVFIHFSWSMAIIQLKVHEIITTCKSETALIVSKAKLFSVLALPYIPLVWGALASSFHQRINHGIMGGSKGGRRDHSSISSQLKVWTLNEIFVVCNWASEMKY